MKTCDVCGKTAPTFLISSGIAPVTYVICSDCEHRGAESVEVISVWLATYGGPDGAPDFFTKLNSFIDGQYVGRSEISDYYRRNEKRILEKIDEDYRLADDDD